MQVLAGIPRAVPLLVGITAGAAGVAVSEATGARRALVAGTAVLGAGAAAALVAGRAAAPQAMLGALLAGAGLTALEIRLRGDDRPTMTIAPAPFPGASVRTLEFSPDDAAGTRLGPIPTHVDEQVGRTVDA